LTDSTGDMEPGRRRRRDIAARASPHTLALLVFLAIASSLILSFIPRGAESARFIPQAQDFSAQSILEMSPLDTGTATEVQRGLYPYSVIPRGVASIKELKGTLARDPVVAAHYASFDVARARVVRAERNRAVYVSYRLGNKVYWTKNKMLVPRGETLITDGTHTARTRCGNRISESPMAPVSLAEPTTKTFDEFSRPAFPKFPLEPFDLPALWASNDTPASFPLSSGPTAPGGGIYIPPVPPMFCCSGGGTPPVPITPPPPIRTPEPGTLLLVLIGLATASLLRKR
jgi:hypothetical protein